MATTSLGELARLFLRLGATAFGGPAAHIALMEDEVVRRREWLTRPAFFDLVSATNFIPGPNSTELAIHIGYARAGWPGLVVSGLCFILPASLIVYALAWGYVRFGALPDLAGVLAGVKPVVVAVIAQALWGFGRSALKDVALGAIAVMSVAALASGVYELVVLAAAGLATASGRMASRRGAVRAVVPVPPAFAAAVPTAAAAAAAVMTAATTGSIFLTFAKIGSVLFGSGYVLVAFLRTDLVERFGWLTEAQLVDAIAVGQLTPGPVFTTATFAGYLVGGTTGAVAATAGIFLPAFIFVALSLPLLPRLRRSPITAAALDGVNVASLALMAAVSWHLGRGAIVDAPTAALAVASLVLLVRYRVNSAGLILGGAITGWAVL